MEKISFKWNKRKNFFCFSCHFCSPPFCLWSVVLFFSFWKWIFLLMTNLKRYNRAHYTNFDAVYSGNEGTDGFSFSTYQCFFLISVSMSICCAFICFLYLINWPAQAFMRPSSAIWLYTNPSQRIKSKPDAKATANALLLPPLNIYNTTTRILLMFAVQCKNNYVIFHDYYIQW